MKLELKHISCYLPYKLKCTNSKESYLQTGEDRTGILETLSTEDDDSCVIMGKNGYFLVHFSEVVPILRPLSDLTKEIEVNGEDFVPIEYLIEAHGNGLDYSYLLSTKNVIEYSYAIIEKLLEWHFDIFGLIEKGLAIDINTLK